MRLIKNFNVFALMLLIGFLLSCKPRQLPHEKEVVTITKTVTELKRDTIVTVEADSSYYEAFIECRDGKPLLKPPTGPKPGTTAGKNLQPPKAELDQYGKLKISCHYLQNQLKITLHEKHILEQKLAEKTIVPPPHLIEKQLTWWQKLWLFLGKILTSALVLFILYKIPWKALLRL